MKKLLFVICVVLVSAGMLFAAGASEQKKEETKVALGSAPVTITFWHCASDDAGVLMDKYIKEFNETNKYQITVNAVYQGQYSDATTLMKTILSAENYSELPDIMQLDATGKVAFYDSGKAFTVDNAEAYFGEKIRDNYLEGALGNWEYSGAQLGLPFATSTTVTYYNKGLLAKAGWDHCPDTFADIIKLAADMKAAGITAAAYGTVPNSPTLANWIGQLGGYIVNFKNGSEASATKLECIESGTLKTFLTEWKAMYDAGALVNQSLSTNQFVAGEVAIFTNSSANVSNILTVSSLVSSDELVAVQVSWPNVCSWIRNHEWLSFFWNEANSCTFLWEAPLFVKLKDERSVSWNFTNPCSESDVRTLSCLTLLCIKDVTYSVATKLCRDLTCSSCKWQ